GNQGQDQRRNRRRLSCVCRRWFRRESGGGTTDFSRHLGGAIKADSGKGFERLLAPSIGGGNFSGFHPTTRSELVAGDFQQRGIKTASLGTGLRASDISWPLWAQRSQRGRAGRAATKARRPLGKRMRQANSER